MCVCVCECVSDVVCVSPCSPWISGRCSWRGGGGRPSQSDRQVRLTVGTWCCHGDTCTCIQWVHSVAMVIHVYSGLLN